MCNGELLGVQISLSLSLTHTETTLWLQTRKKIGRFIIFDLLPLILQVEGPKSPEEMLAILQRVLEESSPVLVSARLEAEERRNNMHLREEQDAAYRAALEADQVCYPF